MEKRNSAAHQGVRDGEGEEGFGNLRDLAGLWREEVFRSMVREEGLKLEVGKYAWREMRKRGKLVSLEELHVLLGN